SPNPVVPSASYGDHSVDQELGQYLSLSPHLSVAAESLLPRTISERHRWTLYLCAYLRGRLEADGRKARPHQLRALVDRHYDRILEKLKLRPGETIAVKGEARSVYTHAEHFEDFESMYPETSIDKLPQINK